MLPMPFELPKLACFDMMPSNGLDEAYLRPLIFVGNGALGSG
jgi:hypothetical protein